jgi:sulfite reductase beta subunit-like hemoprotein
LLEKVPHAEVISLFGPLLAAWAASPHASEGFGDFCHRTGRDMLLGLLAKTRTAA